MRCIAGAWSSKYGTMDDLYRATVQCAELGVTEPATQMMGGVAILDMKGTSLRHVANLTPSYAKKTVDLLQVINWFDLSPVKRIKLTFFATGKFPN
jgi:hypothetical protein